MEIIERIYEILNQKDKRAYQLCEVLDIRTSQSWYARLSFWFKIS